MSVFERVALGELMQGDILKLKTFVSWAAADGNVRSEAVEYGIVLSRNCLAVRSATILVARLKAMKVEAFDELTKGELSADQLRRRLDQLRQGASSPDLLYLGTVPGHRNKVRFGVALDAIMTVVVPDEGESRQKWVEAHRVARLCPDYRRQLHLRFFAAVGFEGFDDERSWCDDDLLLLTARARRDWQAAQMSISEVRTKIGVAEAEPNSEKKVAGLKSELARRESEAQMLAVQVRRYEAACKDQGLGDEP